MKRTHVILLGSVFLLLIIAAAGWYAYREYVALAIPTDTRNISLLRSAMERSITVAGPERAYAAFTDAYEHQSFSLQHNAAHLFGESLYEKGGAAAVDICDAKLNYGCYHGFLTRAIASEGLDIIPALDAACAASTNPSVCQHGVGHGILEYLGHTNLEDALSACRLTHQPDPIAGCTSGVFMEYNVPLTAAADGSFSVATRPMRDASRPYDPCLSLADEYQQGCFYALPQWWKQTYGDDFTKIGRLCRETAKEANQNACLLGVGSVVGPTAEFVASRAITLCEAMPDAPSRTRCLVGAAGTFTAASDREGAREVCRAVPIEEQRLCGA